MNLRRRNKAGLGHVRSASHTSLASDFSDTDIEFHDDPDSHAEASPVRAPSSSENKLKKVCRRLVFGTLLMVATSRVIIQGHLATLCLVLIVQTLMFRELVNVRYSQRRVKDLPLFRTTQWGWFVTCMIYSYGQIFYSERMYSLISSHLIARLIPYINLFSLGLYSLLLMTFVFTLEPRYYKYQVGQLAWTVVSIVITVVQVNSFTHNIFNGLFWFLFPLSLVICNDSFAYFCGLACGRRSAPPPRRRRRGAPADARRRA